jgi:hypothetical protein
VYVDFDYVKSILHIKVKVKVKGKQFLCRSVQAHRVPAG